jgi:beta-glucosidase-like glycosyl hydrolase
MTAHVAYPRWDGSGLPATLSTRILEYLRNELQFRGVVVTDALIMEGALKGRGEARASVDAVRAGCDALLYPLDAAGVALALEGAAAADPAMRRRCDEAVQRVRSLAESMNAAPAPAADLAEHQRFAAAVADRAVHTLRGDALRLRAPLSLSIVDDDIGGPYSVGPRDILTHQLSAAGIELRTGGSRVLLIFSEPRSWKGHALLSKMSFAAVAREIPRTDLVLLFGHPRLMAQIPGEMPVVCAWHGQPLMQEAAARWITGRLR